MKVGALLSPPSRAASGLVPSGCTADFVPPLPDAPLIPWSVGPPGGAALCSGPRPA